MGWESLLVRQASITRDPSCRPHASFASRFLVEKLMGIDNRFPMGILSFRPGLILVSCDSLAGAGCVSRHRTRIHRNHLTTK
jgi:hypothetical protein